MSMPPTDKPAAPSAPPDAAPALPDAAPAPQAVLSHQEKVYFEMFRAIELLGRKLEKAEAERYMLSRRLADIEAGAERDEKTGRLYLPAKIDMPSAAPAAGGWQPRLALCAAAASMVIAFCALGAVLMQDMPQKRAAPQIAAHEMPSAAPRMVQGAAAPHMVQGVSTPVAGIWHRRADETEGQARAEVTAQTEVPTQKPLPAAEESVFAAAEPAVQEETQDALALLAADMQRQEPAAQDDDTDDFDTHLAAALDDLHADAKNDLLRGDDLALTQAEDMPDAPQGAVMASLRGDAAPESTQKIQTPQAQTPPPASPSATAAAAVPPVREKTSAPLLPEKKSAPLLRDGRLPPPFQALEARAFDGVAEAQHDLAAAYADGRRVRQDYARARAWFARAADGGVANAHYNLGVMAQQGLGAPADARAAAAHYEQAALLGHAQAMYNLGLMYVEGRGLPRNQTRAAAYFKRAANAGMVQAAYNLGVLYEGDALGKPDIDSAIEWYEAAAGEGHREAAVAARRLNRQRSQSAKQ